MYCCAFTFLKTLLLFHYSNNTNKLFQSRSAINSNVQKFRSDIQTYFYYRAMHFSAKRGMAIACRLSICLSVSPSVTLVNCDHIGWNSSKIISPLVSLGRSLFTTPTWRVCSGTPLNWGPKSPTYPLLIWAPETFDRKLRPNGYR